MRICRGFSWSLATSTARFRVGGARHRSSGSLKGTLPENLELLNSRVLSDSALASLVSQKVWESLLETRESGKRMPKKHRDELADGILEWALDRGADTFAHWFSPMRGAVHGEKVETFVEYDYDNNQVVVDLTGDRLFMAETDGSSFPNGGLRKTHEAAAFVSWDTTSPPFLFEKVLYVPSVFVSWKGEALDQKTPLLRSQEVVSREAVRFLKHQGDQKTSKVHANIGWEQEFFVVDRKMALERDDIKACQRAIFGQTPLKGQEQSQNYFSKMPTKIRRFLEVVRNKLLAMGIPVMVAHSEVAPGQFEIAPIYSRGTSYGADCNILAMDVLKTVAADMDLLVLFHEKPFQGINGSGKHNNWSLATGEGVNLMDTGKTKEDLRRFAGMLAALTHGMKTHGDILRASVSSAGNDHRLGAQEAPPPIFTIHLGEGLEKLIKGIANGDEFAPESVEKKIIPVGGGVADLSVPSEDRNRTSPFPFCGNRFEFRAVGSEQHIGLPLTVANTIIGDGFSIMSDRVENGEDVDEVVRSVLKENEGVLFSGDGYDSGLLTNVAAKEGLFNIKTSPKAYDAFASAKSIELFSKHGVLNEPEVKARAEVFREEFSNVISIEARVMVNMVRTKMIPAVCNDLNRNGNIAEVMSTPTYKKKTRLLQDLVTESETLEDVLESVPEDAKEASHYCQEIVRPQISKTAEIVDMLEHRIKDYPFPTHSELVFSTKD